MGQPREHWIAQAYDALGPGLYRYALVILADAALAEDAVQEAFMRLLGRGRMDDLVSAKAYLRVIVRNEAYRLMERRRSMESIEDPGARLLEPVESASENAEERGQLEAALRQLPPDQREVVHLKVWEQMTFIEIAELLKIPQNTAASRYRYAISRLRELLPQSRSST